MQTWDVRSLDVEPHSPKVLHSNDEGRTIVINLGGEKMAIIDLLLVTKITHGNGARRRQDR